MDRETRKANLKKLQLPKSLEGKQRTTRQTKKASSQNGTTAISNYFVSPEKLSNKNINKGTEGICSKITIETANNNDKSNKPDISGSPLKKTITSHSKRTKLDGFIFKDPKNIPPSSLRKDIRKSTNDDDFFVPEKKVKKAPKLVTSNSQPKSSKASETKKKQTTIKSAFLRNEEMFAEIAAQHCAVDQFNGDDVQLALAISKSEAESKRNTCSKEEAEDVVIIEDCDKNSDLIREKLMKYGFRTAEKKDYNTFAAAFLPNAKRLKSKWANKFTALTLRQPEIQLKKLQNNIDNILNSKFRTKAITTEEPNTPKYYSLQSSLLKQSCVAGKNRILHNLNEENQPNEIFFVKELFDINVLPLGYLLKDWSAIQGRDLTPKVKNSQHKKRLQKLEYIYQELEEYFKSKRCLNWFDTKDDSLEEQRESHMSEVSAIQENLEYRTKVEYQQENNIEIKVNSKKTEITAIEEKVELDEMIELIQEMQSDNVETENIQCYSTKIKILLPTTKSLQNMEVSGCSLNTQATLNTTQKTRSNSPDLFADSDVEMEETPPKAENNENLVKNSTLCIKNDSFNNTIDKLNCKADDIKESHNNGAENIETGVTTYEIFSSDEVKNISSFKMILNKSTKQDSAISNSNINSGKHIIDLTQDELHSPNHNEVNYTLNQSKAIEEIDLFAESPLQEEHNPTDIESSPEHPRDVSDDDTLKLMLSLKPNKNSKSINGDSFIFSLSPDIKDQIHDFKADNENIEDDIVLREIVFEDSKHLEKYVHKETANIVEEVSKDVLTDNDIIFRELCNKYLSEQNNSFSLKRKNGDYEKSFSQPYTNFTMDFDLNMDCEKSFTQLIHKKTKPQKSINYTNIAKDLNVTEKTGIDFKNENLNVSVDLTQHEEDTGDSDLIEENDDCLILSDDEINYSIWQANKTFENHATEQSDMENEVISIPDVDTSSDEENKQSKDIPLINTSKPKPAKESYSDIEIFKSKYDKSKELSQEEAKFDRSEFGILEEYSQPIDFTPTLCTPTKVLMDVSFLSSPTEKSAPMKFYSNCRTSSQKFQDLLKNIDEKSPPFANTLDDFDEFDRLVYVSPSKTKRSSIKKPKGIEKLLTAEISFTEKASVSKKVTKNLVSPIKLASDVQEIKYNNKTYKLRYVNSPKPNYTQFSEEELLKELYNFGIKPLKRKQAVKMLEYIYNQTHPIIKDETVENNGIAPKENKQNADKNYCSTFDQPCSSNSVLYFNNLKTSDSSENELTIPNAKYEVYNNVSQTVNAKLNLHDSCGRDMLRYSDIINAELCDENYILQTNVTKKTPRPLLPFHIAWYNLVCSNDKLHETILMYEPIDLQEIYLFFKGLGYRYEPKDLKTFFDQRCIIFRYDLTPATKEVNRHVRKSKKTKVIKLKDI